LKNFKFVLLLLPFAFEFSSFHLNFTLCVFASNFDLLKACLLKENTLFIFRLAFFRLENSCHQAKKLIDHKHFISLNQKLFLTQLVFKIYATASQSDLQ